MDQHYHLFPAHKHRCAPHSAVHAPGLVHLCDTTWILTRQWRHSRQWRISQTRWRLAHWRRHRWCTKVSLGHRTGMQEWYSAARRHWVTPSATNFLGSWSGTWQKPFSTHHLQPVSVFPECANPLVMAKKPLIRRSSLPRPLQDHTNGTLYDTRNHSNIHLSVPSTDGIRVNLTPLCPLTCPTSTFNDSAYSKLHEMLSQGNPLLKSIQTTSRSYVSKSFAFFCGFLAAT